MGRSIQVNVFKVFCNKNGEFGNPVGIIMDPKREISARIRKRIAIDLKFSESVFVNNLAIGSVTIYNPQGDEDFAGHALVGTAYYIKNILKKPAMSLQCTKGSVSVKFSNNLTFIKANLENTPPWHHVELESPSDVDQLVSSELPYKQHTIVWAWISKNKGLVRARTFAPDWGIPEDEANGSGSMQLAAELNRKLEIHHGHGSLIFAQPDQAGYAQVGGRVTPPNPAFYWRLLR